MSDQRTLASTVVEVLESRTLLSGNVAAMVNRFGDLLVVGDAQNNDIMVSLSGNRVHITGENGTTVNGRPEGSFGKVRRDIIVSLGRGDDVLKLTDVGVTGKIRVDGGGGSDTVHSDRTSSKLLKSDGVEVKAVARSNGEARALGLLANQIDIPAGPGAAAIDPGVMLVKMNQAIQQLTRRGLGENVYLQAINEGMEAIYMSNLVVLPTFNPQDPGIQQATHESFDMQQSMAQQLINALNVHINQNIGNANTQADAANARNFVEVTNEAMQVIAQQTAEANVLQPDSNPLLVEKDDGGTLVDDVLANAAAREVRRPFPYFVYGLSSTVPEEQVILPAGPLAPDACSAIVKEIQGIKAIVTPRLIPIWVEPWYARATIIGYRTVWTWEWVPAEFIKTLTFCNAPVNPANPSAGRKIVTSSEIKTIVERQLMHFWTFFHKNITPVPGAGGDTINVGLGNASTGVLR